MRLFRPRDPSLVNWSREHITRAAVFTPNNLYIGNEGERHHDVLRRMPMRQSDYEERPIQGFMTSSGRFVDREVAAIIAKECGQLESTSSASVLFSEDVW